MVLRCKRPKATVVPPHRLGQARMLRAEIAADSANPTLVALRCCPPPNVAHRDSGYDLQQLLLPPVWYWNVRCGRCGRCRRGRRCVCCALVGRWVAGHRLPAVKPWVDVRVADSVARRDCTPLVEHLLQRFGLWSRGDAHGTVRPWSRADAAVPRHVGACSRRRLGDVFVYAVEITEPLLFIVLHVAFTRLEALFAIRPAGPSRGLRTSAAPSALYSGCTGPCTAAGSSRWMRSPRRAARRARSTRPARRG